MAYRDDGCALASRHWPHGTQNTSFLRLQMGALSPLLPLRFEKSCRSTFKITGLARLFTQGAVCIAGLGVEARFIVKRNLVQEQK